MTMLNYWGRIIRGPLYKGVPMSSAALPTGALPPGNPELDAEPQTEVGKRTNGSLLLVFAALASGWAAVPTHPPAKRPQVAAKSGDLASLVSAWRESPTPARRQAVESYAAAHAKDNNGTLARLALGVGAYEQKDFAAAISALRKVQSKLPALADYTAYYLALARLESKDTEVMAADLAPAHSTEIRSPVAGKAWLVEARALEAADAAESVRVLREHYAELPQPEGDVTLADCYQAADDLPHAAEFYQRVYYQYLTGDASHARRGRPADPQGQPWAQLIPQPLPAAVFAPRRSPAGSPRLRAGARRNIESLARSTGWAWPRPGAGADRRGRFSRAARRRPPAPICGAWNCRIPRPTPSASITWKSARASRTTMAR